MNAKISVITANEEASGQNIHVVPKSSNVRRFRLIKDDGVAWKKDVTNFCNKCDLENPDVIIISGSPFMHFGLSAYFQRKYGAKVILDYRDPFAVNPGFNNSKLKLIAKKYFERKFNKHADALVTVNSFCGELIEGFNNKPNAIVQNGFDETVFPLVKDVSHQEPTFSYTGKFYFDPQPILEAMHQTGSDIYIAGPDKVSGKEAAYQEVNEVGFVTYPEAVQLVADHDVAIIQTYGEDFQSTTKIFDYVRCGRTILVVSNKYLNRGSIHQELQGYPNVFWCMNTTESIMEAINTIRSTDYIDPNPDFASKFSRHSQMLRLIELINSIV